MYRLSILAALLAGAAMAAAQNKEQSPRPGGPDKPAAVKPVENGDKKPVPSPATPKLKPPENTPAPKVAPAVAPKAPAAPKVAPAVAPMPPAAPKAAPAVAPKAPATAAAKPTENVVVPPNKGESKTIQLFDGKTLNGWTGYSDLWSVKNGAIVARNDKPLKFSTYLLTKDQYTDFRITFASKLVESEMHSGISFWGEVRPSVSKDPKADRTEHTYAGHLVMFPSGYGMYDLFGRNGLPVDGAPARKVGKQHDWNDVEVLAQGNRVRVAVNGKAVVDWYDPEPKRIKAGPIGLQLHSNNVPQEILFKGLVIETFPKENKLITVK